MIPKYLISETKSERYFLILRSTNVYSMRETNEDCKHRRNIL